MPQAPAFSRLQLAAALLEYDNASASAPIRRAQDSAIFAHLRRNPAAPPQSSRKSDYLGVSLPSESGSLGGRESALESRRSRASRGSLDALRNPFSHDDHWSDEEEGNEEVLEVDLASWGLDALIPKDKGKAKGKAKAIPFPLHPVSSVRSHIPLTNNASAAAAPRRAINTSRSVSLGGIAEHPSLNNEFLEATNKRRRSFGSPLDLVDMEISQLPLRRPRSLSYSAVRPLSSALQSVPFPSSSGRSPSPALGEILDRRVSAGSQFVSRRLSRASIDSKLLFQDEPAKTAEPPSDNPFAIRPPSPSRLSKFDPKAAPHARTTSNISGGSKILPDQVADVPVDYGQDQPKRERKYSTTLELLRPKVLVMPSPLQQVAPATSPAPNQVRDGFMLSTDGPPLPPGALSTRRNSMMAALDSANKLPIASNSFTPNPLMNLSLSQMTFRNTLHIGGMRDPYSDVIGGLPTATQEGEQVEFDASEAQVNDNTLPVSGSTTAGLENRPPGKLFGKSLIDDLETRKTQMRSKQRVFTGDQRPSMMSRTQTQSTFIDPATLNNRPAQRQSSFGIPESKPTLSRKNSLNAKPLLNFDDEPTKFKPLTSTTRITNSRSVFGVDTLWEREMVKLREIEAQEEEQRIQMEQEEQQEKKKSKKGKKKKGQNRVQVQAESHLEVDRADDSRVSIEPPILPNIQRAPRPPPKATMEEVSDDDQSDNDNLEPVANATAGGTGEWFSDSDEDKPLRTTGVGLRHPIKLHQEDADSEDDMPLSTAVNRAVQRQRATRLQLADDSDEEKPLSTLLQKAKPTAPAIPPINFDNLANREADDDDDDNKPLGLRASTIPNRSAHNGDDDDDDRPLAFHPEQQRRTQYQMMAQQQQMMLQAQFQNSMFFSSPSMLGSGFFGPTPMLMQQPIPIPTPPPAQDTAKFGRVDKWRHDVAVEGTL